MIILSEVATKLEKILNGTDEETSDLDNPTPFLFAVATEGFHIDSTADQEKRKNFIPVFISCLGGQFNPVKGIKQGTYTYQVTFYFPVRFKESFFALGDFLVDAFVGSRLNYGEISGKAVSNISVPQFGEIQDLDFAEFKKWVDSNYENKIEKMEPYLTMVISLFLSNSAPGLIYGNDIKMDLSFSYEDKTFTLSNLDWDGSSLQSNAQAQSEQEEETNETDGLPFGTAYGSSFKLYPNLQTKAQEYEYVDQPYWEEGAEYYRKIDNDYVYLGQLTEAEFNGYHSASIALYTREHYLFYKELLKVWLKGDIQQVKGQITIKFDENDQDLWYSRECFIQSIMGPIEKGQLFSLTISVSKRVELEDEE